MFIYIWILLYLSYLLSCTIGIGNNNTDVLSRFSNFSFHWTVSPMIIVTFGGNINRTPREVVQIKQFKDTNIFSFIHFIHLVISWNEHGYIFIALSI